MSSQSLYQYTPKLAAWNQRDLLIFASSIGCSENDLQYLCELDPNFAAFPTYSIVLTFKHDCASTTSFAEHFTTHLTPPMGFIENFPALDIQRVVDGERTLEIVKPLPTTSSGRQFWIQSQVVGVWDKGAGKGTIVKTTHDIFEQPSGSTGPESMLYTRMSETAVFMGQGGWQGPNGPKAFAAPAPPSDRRPTATYRWDIPGTAHLLYRLNGDYNPIHATHVDAAVVQPTPIMHGLYGWNVAARAVLNAFGRNDADALKSFRASFASPVRPGDVLEVEMWDCGDVDRERREVRFLAKVGGRVVLANGVAVMASESQSKQPSKL